MLSLRFSLARGVRLFPPSSPASLADRAKPHLFDGDVPKTGPLHPKSIHDGRSCSRLGRVSLGVMALAFIGVTTVTGGCGGNAPPPSDNGTPNDNGTPDDTGTPNDNGSGASEVTSNNIEQFGGQLDAALGSAVASMVQQLSTANLPSSRTTKSQAARRELHERLGTIDVAGARGSAQVEGSRYLQRWPVRYELNMTFNSFGTDDGLTLTGGLEFNVVLDDSVNPQKLFGLYRGSLELGANFKGQIDVRGAMVDGQTNALEVISNGQLIPHGSSAPPSFLTYVSTIAGTGQVGNADGPGPAATFNTPTGLTLDEAGRIYVADSENGSIRQIDQDGTVSTLIDGLDLPIDVGLDADANLVVTQWGDDDHPISRLILSGPNLGTLEDIVGPEGETLFGFPLCGLPTISCDGRTPIATMHYPNGIDVHDNLIFVAQGGSPSSLRAVLPDGYLLTLHETSGDCGPLGIIGGTADVAAGNHGELYFVNDTYGCYGVLVRDPDGSIRSLAGDLENFGNADGTGAAAQFFNPSGLVFDGERYLYVADSDNNLIRRVDIETGQVIRVAGCLDHTEGFDCDDSFGFRDGPGDFAQFYVPNNVAIDRWGDLYIADGRNHAVRLIRILVDPQRAPTIDHFDPVAIQQGAAAKMTIQGRNLALTEQADLGTGVDVVIEAAGYSRVELRITAASDAPGTSRPLSLTTPYGTITTPEDQSFTVLEPSHQGVQVTTISGTGELVPDQVNLGPATHSTFAFPTGMHAIDRDRLLVADPLEHRIRLIATRVGAVEEIVQLLLWSATDNDVNVLGGILKALGGVGDALSLLGISQAWTDQAEDAIRDLARQAVDEVCDAVNAEDCEWLSLPWAGIPFTPGSGGGFRLNAQFFFPTDVWSAGKGLYYIADTGNQTIRIVGFDPDEQKEDDNIVYTSSRLSEFPFAVTAESGGTVEKPNPVFTVLSSKNVLGLYNLKSNVTDENWAGIFGYAGCQKSPGDARPPLGIPLGAAARGDFVYVADPFCKTIWRIEQAVGAQSVQSIHGDIPLATTGKCADGPASLATFVAPMDVADGPNGNIYVADCGCNSIRVIQDFGLGADLDAVAAGLSEFLGKHNSRLSTDTVNAIQAKLAGKDPDFLDANRYWVYTLAGSSDGAPGYLDGGAHAALFNAPTSIAVVSELGHTYVYVGDTGNRRIRRIVIP